jgi:hypothetical protein
MVATPWSTDQRKCSGDCSKRNIVFSGIGDSPLYQVIFWKITSWIKIIRYLWIVGYYENLWYISYYNDTFINYPY